VPRSVAAGALQLYPCTAGDCRAVASQLLGDFVVTCSNNALLLRHSGATNSYAFNHVPSFPAPAVDPNSTQLGVFHSADIPFALDTLRMVTQNYTGAELQLAADMSAAWVAFASTGNPSIPSQPQFVPVTNASEFRRTAISTGVWSVEVAPMDKCSFWIDVYDKYLME
jgi:para-nitrobenzyl esterase